MTLWLKLALVGGLLAALAAGGWWLHHTIWQSGYDARASMDAKALVHAHKQQVVIDTRVVTQWKVRTKVIRERAATIIKKVPVYVTPADNSRCVINLGFVRLWNDANRMSVPAPATSADEAASAVKLTDVATEHAREAGICHANDAQLRALQSWVKDQGAVK